ncbi:serine/threonine-protein kinase [Dactylosporangium cerinum]
MSFEPAVVPPGLARLRRRLATYHDFLDELVRDIEQSTVDGEPLGRRWDVEGDPRAMKLAQLWAYVAEGVAAYTELAAGEAYLPTAQDWTDLRRLAGLVGYRPQQRVAAQGWVMVDTDRGAAPLVPAGTRVQAPGTPDRPAQVFEVAEETQLYADRAGLTATPVPVPAAPTGPTLRFLQDPGFRVGDRVLFVEELAPTGPAAPPPWSADWSTWWIWLIWWWYLYQAAMSAGATPLAVARVRKRVADLGTVVVTFDRDLGPLLSDPSKVYAAYRVVTAAGSARRQTAAVRIPATGAPSATNDKLQLAAFYTGPANLESAAVVLDTQLDELSPGQRVAVVDWGLGRGATIETTNLPACDVAEPTMHSRLDWEVAPGSTVPASRLQFGSQLAALARATITGRPVRVYVVGPRIPAQHYDLPTAVTGSPARLRLYPAPGAAHPVQRITLRNPAGTWDVLACTPAPASAQELPPPGGGPERPAGSSSTSSGSPCRCPPTGRRPAPTWSGSGTAAPR